ncbi:MAG TPA: glycosyltransferase family 4 protein [Gemmataceae bacterium]|nr:glycosyltransferase family 4 protein [Gemmataceae bacterium]
MSEGRRQYFSRALAAVKERLAPGPAPASRSLAYPRLSTIRQTGQVIKKSVCIATPDIAGPSRNGGIGSAYAELAELLAREGHDVTVAYLRGEEVDDGSVGDWIEHYAKKHIALVPVADAAHKDDFGLAGEPALQTSYNLFVHLLGERYDLVHVSEWRGAGYFSLVAKHLRLAFADRIFAVKSSSPREWVLESVGRKIAPSDRSIIEAERGSIALADLVIGGSNHLLAWMTARGFAMPAGRVFAQPNVMAPPLPNPARRAGERVPVTELVFFGRLEPRKGLAVFCDAVEAVARKSGSFPATTFLGKEGMAMRDGEPSVQWLRKRTAGWSPKPNLQLAYDRYAALTYLQAEGRLAVMPSLIENSSIAVYEALLAHLPFVASDVGGTPELVAAQDQAEVLVEPHAESLARKLDRALRHGALVPHPSFDNGENLKTWTDFHHLPNSAILEQIYPVKDAQEPAPAWSQPFWRLAEPAIIRKIAELRKV